MADSYIYSQDIINIFIKDKICQGDALLYKYYQEVNISKFRSRISKFKTAEDDIYVAIQTYITDATRDVIFQVIRNLVEYLKPYGDLILSGGEAFNTYLTPEHRVITTDIDTKFTPVVRLSNNKLITSSSPYMFGFIQCTKLALWDRLGKIVTQLNDTICSRIQKFVIDSSPLGKLFGISFPNKGHQVLRRRYTLIKKSKESSVLIDIEVFAIDLQLKYYDPAFKKITLHNIGGLLDIAFMRPKEFGFEATYTRNRGVSIRNPITKKITHDNKILVASKKFLINDLYALQKYKLRPGKKKKDQQRMYIFCRYILNIKNIKQSDSLESIYKKSIGKVKSSSKSLLNRPILTKRIMSTALRTDPYKYKSVTTRPCKDKIVKQLFYGIKGTSGLNIPKYSPTYSNYRFLANKGEWIKNNSPLYIHNESNYRPDTIINSKLVPPLEDILYGYNPSRNNWMSKILVQKAAMIPLVGLKIKVL